MRLRTFLAPSMPEAMEAVRTALGPDAIILSSSVSAKGSVEIKAAVELEALPRAIVRSAGPATLEGGHRLETVSEAKTSEYGFSSDPYGQNPLESLLLWAGADSGDARRWASAHRHSEPNDLKQALLRAAETEIGYAPFPTLPDKPIALLGLPGAGRTSIAAKLAARALQAGGDPIIVSYDVLRAGGSATLEALACRLGAGFAEAENREDLARTVAKGTEAGRFVVIDCPSVARTLHREVERSIAQCKQGGVEPVLVLAADSNPADSAEVAAAFAAAGVRRVVVTRLDLTKRRAGIFMAVAGAGLKLTQLAESPFIGGGLAPASAARLSRLILEAAPVEFAEHFLSFKQSHAA